MVPKLYFLIVLTNRFSVGKLYRNPGEHRLRINFRTMLYKQMCTQTWTSGSVLTNLAHLRMTYRAKCAFTVVCCMYMYLRTYIATYSSHIALKKMYRALVSFMLNGRERSHAYVLHGPAVVSVDSNIFIYSLICDIDFIMVISDHYLDTWVCLYSNVVVMNSWWTVLN